MIVDSNVFLALLNPEAEVSSDVREAFARHAAARALYLNHVIFAEISPPFPHREMLEQVIAELGVELVALSADDAFRAGTAFRAYRRNGGPRIAILPDFLIGAQAAVRGWPILTRDPRRFSSYFPEVELIDPLAAET